MAEKFIYECECVECRHEWTSPPLEQPPFSCPECESNDIQVVKKIPKKPSEVETHDRSQ
jgi:Zn finger protein HypA/HybF involved in hydrogenase expression